MKTFFVSNKNSIFSLSTKNSFFFSQVKTFLFSNENSFSLSWKIFFLNWKHSFVKMKYPSQTPMLKKCFLSFFNTVHFFFFSVTLYCQMPSNYVFTQKLRFSFLLHFWYSLWTQYLFNYRIQNQQQWGEKKQ